MPHAHTRRKKHRHTDRHTDIGRERCRATSEAARLGREAGVGEARSPLSMPLIPDDALIAV